MYVGHDNPCNDYCEHGVCQIKGPASEPTCKCNEDWSGQRCEISLKCNNYCKNGGTCSISENMRYCDCLAEYEGVICENKKDYAPSSEETNKKDSKLPAEQKPGDESSATTIIVTIIIVCLLLISFVASYFFLKKRQLFTHERLQENDFNNPMYQDRDAEPFALGTDKVLNYFF